MEVRRVLRNSGPSHELIPVPTFILGGWHPDAHRAVRHNATFIASRAMIPFETDSSRVSLTTASGTIGGGE